MRLVGCVVALFSIVILYSMTAFLAMDMTSIINILLVEKYSLSNQWKPEQRTQLSAQIDKLVPEYAAQDFESFGYQKMSTPQHHLSISMSSAPKMSVTNCSSGAIFHKPNIFLNCVQNSSLTCDQESYLQWNVAVRLRYDRLDTYFGLPRKRVKYIPSQHIPDGCVDARYISSHGPSGPGSSLDATANLRSLLPKLFLDLGIKTFMDVPCGDWLWMQTVNLTGLQYFGADISDVTIKQNKRCFESNNIRFFFFDLKCMIAPPVDLLLVRDVLFHLPEDQVMSVLRNINKSGAKYLLTTTFKDGSEYWKAGNAYVDSLGTRGGKSRNKIGFGKLNLYAPPFLFPQPIARVPEDSQGFREVGLWKLPIILPEVQKYINSEGNVRELHTERKTASCAGGLTLVVFWVVNKFNHKHNEGYYLSRLKHTCSHVRTLADQYNSRAVGVGDVDKIWSVPECQFLSVGVRFTHTEAHEMYPFSTHALKSMNSTCQIKFGLHIPLVKSSPDLWLIKVHALCQIASKNPDGLTVYVDAGLPVDHHKILIRHIEHRCTSKARDKSGLLTHSYPLYRKLVKRKHWFGTQSCREAPRCSAAIMSIRGRDCQNIQQLFRDEVVEATNIAERANHEGGCGCFDEEIVLTRLLNKTSRIGLFDEQRRDADKEY